MLFLCFALLLLSPGAGAQVGWLRYAIPPDPPRYHDLPHTVVVLGNAAGREAPEEAAAADELDRGLGHMVAGTDLLLHRFDPRVDALVLGTTEALHRARIGRSLPGWVEKPVPEEGFRIVHLRRGIRQWYILQGGSPRAELWAAFRFSALVAEDQQLPEELVDAPQIAMRGFDLGAGMEARKLLADEARLTVLGRLMASTGSNTLLASADAETAGDAARLLQGFGIRLWFHAGLELGAERAAQLAASGVSGFAVTVPQHATAASVQQAVAKANALAAALPKGTGVLLAGILGDALQSPADAEQRAAMLRGGLSPRVLVGGLAASPLTPLAGLGSAAFGLLPDRPQAATLAVLPGKLDELAYPFGAWQRTLQTPERGPHGDTLLATLLHGENDGSRGALLGTLPAESMATVMEQPLLQVNLYGFGRLAWNPSLHEDAVAEEWARQTWGDDARVFGVAQRIVTASGPAFVSYTSPFGLQSLADASGGPAPSRVNVAVRLVDAEGIGTDRAGAAALYPQHFAAELADVAACPDEFLLAFHHVPYAAKLHSGKPVAQAFYDAHFAGASQAANALDAWEGTKELLPPERYMPVHAFLEVASRRAEIWRETATEWLQHVSSVPDALGFVGRHPGRIEAEAMRLTGYAPHTLPEREDASGGAVATCRGGSCTAATVFGGDESVYRVEVGSFAGTLPGGSFALRVNGRELARWAAAATPGATVTPAFAERFVVNGVRLKKGDTLEVRSEGDGPLDFVEITRDPRWN